MRAALLAVAILLFSAVESSAEWQARPFLGISFAADTTFALSEGSVAPNVVIGGSGALLGDVFGVEGDFGWGPGFFQSGGDPLVRGNNVTTLTGNAIIAVPRHLTRYTLAPYLVVGGGLMHVHIDDFAGFFPIVSNMPVMDIGGGVTGFLTNRLGLNWEARYFSSVGEGKLRGQSADPQDPREHLSFWRASMGLVIR